MGANISFTLGALPGLDNIHSVFGQVRSGLDVLSAIGDVDLQNGSPVDAITIHNVSILRVGQIAEDFNAINQGLPLVGGAEVSISIRGPWSI